MTRIILDCDLMKFPHTGLYYYCQQLGQHVNALLAEENQPLMHLYRPPLRKLALSPEPHHLVERKWHRLLQPFLENCRVWHAPFQSGRIVPNKKKFPHVRVVLTVHDLNVMHEGKPAAVQQKSLAHTQALIDRSDALVCISEFTKTDVLTHCVVKDKPVYVIHNGANPLPERVGEGQAYKPDRAFLLGIGYLNPKKNFHVLLPLLQTDPALELVIVGHHDDPAYVSLMKQMAQRLGVASRLHLPGTVSEADKVWYLKHCRALVHPSLAEGFGLPVIEAMQVGKPVFLSTFTSLPEVGGAAAFYFPDFSASSVQAAYQQGMRTYETTNRAEAIIRNAARFDWKQTARQYVDVYQSLID